METKQVIVIRKDLKMRKGKIASQACHASMKAIIDQGNIEYTQEYPVNGQLIVPLNAFMNRWLEGIFTKICVSVDSEEELLDIYKQGCDAGIVCSLIRDVGLTEFDGVPTYTAVAIGPGLNEDIDKITGHLKLL